MKLTEILRETWTVYRAHGKDWLRMTLLEAALRLMTLAPLLFLNVPQTRPLALLSIPMALLIVLPARQNAARAIANALEGESPFTLGLISRENYGAKLRRGLAALLRQLLWSLPLIASLSVGAWAMRGSVDAFTLLRAVSSLGGGSMEKGLILVALIFLLSALPALIGCAFHSGTRHALAQGGSVKGCRGWTMLLWAVSTLIPCVLAMIWPVSAVIGALKGFLQTFELSLPGTGSVIAWAALTCLILAPLYPVKALLPAVCVRLNRRRKASADAAA